MLPPFAPQLCSPIDQLPDPEGFVAEIKYDGWRALAVCEGDGVRLMTRNGGAVKSLPYLEQQLSWLPQGTVLDGEIIDPTRLEGGWNRVSSICSSTRPHHPHADDPALCLVVFDVLFLGGVDARELPWQQRRLALEALLARPLEQVQLVETHEPSEALMAELLEQGHEGLVIKRCDAPYSGGRSGAWSKIKPEQDLQCEAVITGLQPGRGEFAGMVGCLEFELPSGAQGRCSGMDTRLRREMTDQPERFLGQVVELAHWGVNPSGKLRHPVFRRLRPDRSAEEVRSGTPVPIVAPAPAVRTRRAASSSRSRRVRNYRAMKDSKLLECLASLRSRGGDAYDRCLTSGSGDPEADLRLVQSLASERGLGR